MVLFESEQTLAIDAGLGNVKGGPTLLKLAASAPMRAGQRHQVREVDRKDLANEPLSTMTL